MHRLTEFSLKRPWLTLAILLAITVGLGLGVPKVKQAYGFRVMIGEGHPGIRALDSMIEEFSGGYPVLVAWECGEGQPCANVFDESSLKMADALTRELASSSHIASVTGPANASLLIPSEQGFETRRFMENGVLASDSQWLTDRALDDPFWVGSIVSKDAQVGVIVVQPPDNRPDTDLEVAAILYAALEPFEKQGFSYHISGDGTVASRALADSTNALIPFLALVIAAILYLLTRSWQQTLIAMCTLGVAMVWTRGVLGWLGWPQDGMLQVLAPLVVIVGVCDAMHLLNRYAAEQRRDRSVSIHAALLSAARDAGPACVITTLTSAVAFASFTISNLDTFVRFGVILPVGVLACLLLSFSMLPILIGLLPREGERSERTSTIWKPVLSAIVSASSRRAGLLLFITFLLLGVFGYGWAVHLRADTDWSESLGESSTVVLADEFLTEALGGSKTLELDIQLPPGTNIENPATLATLDRCSKSLAHVKTLGEPKSVLNLIERLNRLINNDQPAFERAGDSEHANAELLELISFEDPATLGYWLSMDHSRLRISQSAIMLPMHEREELLADVQRRARIELPQDWSMQLTGDIALERDWLRDVQATQLRSFPIAFGIVFILVSVFLRSWKLGLAAMVPTLLPVVVVLGAMGWIGMSLDVARAMLAAVVIGIGVDDAIHLLAHYKVRREEGDDPHAAIAAALQHTGRAIVTTSVALALGFLTLMMSAWQTVASFGFFVAIAIMGALVATLFVLPALIFAFTKGQKADPT